MRAAIISSGFKWPLKRVTVNLAPSGLRKAGSGLDVAIALGVMAADDQLPAQSLEGLAFVGELGLDGSLRRVPGVLPSRGGRCRKPLSSCHRPVPERRPSSNGSPYERLRA